MIRVVAKQNLQTLMKIMGYDVPRLSQATGYATTQIYQILARTIDPSMRFVKKVSELFGVVNIGEIVEIVHVEPNAPSELEINIMFEQKRSEDEEGKSTSEV